ncbi:hypothetical protein [Parasphingopyxis marina]|uniref:Uncharacterized protein n=1 Tax=Parasphingopyxis marina TaxID=2761622 RepID=A0A842HU47_9SPHN|nr:hypothetical protein [Parasphingopyxis marina]MBC2776455.1 hypothetical protein [Parasphingopyxis marina]
MTRAAAIMPLIGAVAAIAGLAVLLKPGALRARLGLSDSEASAYALRIVGAMLFALGLFLGGFTLALNS